MNGYRWKESDTKVVIERLLQRIGDNNLHNAGITHRDLRLGVSTPAPSPKPLQSKLNGRQDIFLYLREWGSRLPCKN